MGCVYKATNTITGFSYIGITMKPEGARWNEHVRWAVRGRPKTRLHRAIRKYGAEVFELKILFSSDNWKLLCRLECHFIKKLLTKHPTGYNLTDGGEGIVGLRRTKAQCVKISKSRKGMKFTEQHCLNLSKALSGLPRAPRSERTKEIQSVKAVEVSGRPGEKQRRSERAKRQHAEGKFGRATWKTDPVEVVRKIAASNLGKTRSPESCARSSESAKQRYERLSPEQKSEVGRRQARAFWESLTPAQRKKHGRKISLGRRQPDRPRSKYRVKNGEGKLRSVYRPETAYEVAV